MPADPTRWVLALAAATIICVAARRRRSLSRDGMIAAIAVGTVLVGAAGWGAGLLLVAFFLTSSLLSDAHTRSSLDQVRGAERDAVQVFANGGVALLAAVGSSVIGSPALVVAMAGSIAAANADTWSTEIGRTSTSRPRLITTWMQVDPGTSGAVSRRGLSGALAGSALISALACIGWTLGWLPGPESPVVSSIAVLAAGFSGSIIDSLLGATVQDQRYCDSCQKHTESVVHRCGSPTRSIRGLPGINNDLVNFLCSLSGASIAALMYTLS
jgi:uncharacterized protein (TIGR00297 family)